MAERVVALLHHSPALHKLGQVVARDRRLDIGFRKRLQQLESLEPRTPASNVVRLLQRELKGWRTAGIELGPGALAEGSVAVVMPFTWRGAEVRESREGVFKLLKPGVEERLEEDLNILVSLGDFLDEGCRRYHLPELDYRGTFDTIRELLLHEIRLDEEQRHLAEAANAYASVQSVIIPGLLPFCSPRLTAMTRIHGEKIAGDVLPTACSPRILARTVAESLVAQPMFSSHPPAPFHGDPHAGNLLVTPDGRLGILDWSLSARLRKRDRIELVQLVLGALALDAGRTACAVENLTHRTFDKTALKSVLHSSLRELRWGTAPGISWLTRLLDELVMRASVRFDTELMLFRKSLFTLDGVLADLAQAEDAGRALLDDVLLKLFVLRLSAEWPERFRAPFHSRSFSTHLSTADLFSMLWSAPPTFMRWWSGTWLDLLDNAAPAASSTIRYRWAPAVRDSDD